MGHMYASHRLSLMQLLSASANAWDNHVPLIVLLSCGYVACE